MEEIENECSLSEEEENESVSTMPSTSSRGPNHGPVTENNDEIVLPSKNKRKRSTDVRRRIRKIMSPEQLDIQTVSAQNEEKERLRRLELQKSLNTLKSGDVGERQTTSIPTLSDSPLDTGINRPAASPVLVDIPSKKPKPIIVIDDSDNESDDDCDVVETSNFAADPIIEISDSGSDSEVDVANVDDEVEPETSGSHTNDDVNQPNAEGKVLVNVNHPPTEPDIFLSPYLSKCVKPHQIGGIRFLYDNLVESLSRFEVSPGFGCILAHSMGLGKTLQLICFIDVLFNFTKATKVLCIVPMNTIQNWYSEFNTWLPEKTEDEQSKEDTDDSGPTDTPNEVPKTRNYKVYLLSDGVKTTVARSALIDKWFKNGGVLLMGYEMYRILAMYSPSLANNAKLTSNKRKKPSSTSTEVIDLDEEEKNMDLLLEIQKALCKPGPDLVVCDEGHRIKNNQANVSQALKRIHTRRRVVLTGYPLQNNLLEYWCMVDFVRPNFLGTRHEFSNMFERPIVNGQCMDSTAADTKLMRFRAHVLHSLLEGFVQRRSEAVLRQTLPAKEEYVVPVKMSPIQMSLYNAFVSSVKNYVGYVNPIRAFSISIKIWNHPDILKQYLDRKKSGARNDSPLTVVDPDLDIGENLTKKMKESKNEALQRVVGLEGGIVPSEVKASIANSTDWVGNLLDDYEPDVLQNGTKMVILTEIIEKTVAMGDKLLVFSQSLSTLSMIEDFLRKRVVPPRPSQLLFQPVHWERNRNYYRLDGGTSSQEREKLITAFNLKINESVFVFLLSTRACSLGVNLIGANRVVIFDASWNPCHDAQAVCRVYRYGQTKKCFIYRLVSNGTFEKRMYERQVTKEGMSDRVIDELNPEANLTKQEVMSLFNETETEVTESAANEVSSSPDKFADPVLNHVCEMLAKAIDEIPFKHKLQTSQRSRNTLTKAEKREAKKGYEREKRAIISANRFVPISENATAIVREQMRRDAISRPVGHVKPIQNILPNTAISSRLPATLSLAVPPAFPHRSMATMPSMAFFPPASHHSMSYGRYFPPGELRPFPPFVKNPAAVSSNGGGMLKRQTPIIVNLLAENEDGGRTSFGSKTENTKTAEEACVGAHTATAVNSQMGGFCDKDPRDFVMVVDDTGQSSSGKSLLTCSKNDGSYLLSSHTAAATPSDDSHMLSEKPVKCGADDASHAHIAVAKLPGVTESSNSISIDPAATSVENVDGLSADVAMPSVDDTGRSSPVVTSECSSESRDVVDEKADKCGPLAAETKSENGPACSKEVAEV